MKRKWNWWIGSFISIVFLYVFIVGGINYAMDPLWNFSHTPLWGKFQTAFDERRQKTNWIAHHSYAKKGVLFGNSRITIFDPQWFFPEEEGFNYAVGDMLPLEYPAFLDHFIHHNNGVVKEVVLGVSFRGTAGQFVEWVKKRRSTPEEYVKQAENPLYRYTSLLDFSLFRHSLRSLVSGIPHGYGRKKGRILVPVVVANLTPEKIRETIPAGIKENRNLFGRGYTFTSDIPVYRAMKQAHPSVQFTVFTTPVSFHILKVLLEEGRLGEYEKWLRDLVQEFGGIWQFMDLNSITMDERNYVDTGHFSSGIARMVAARIRNDISMTVPGDFGVFLTQSNIDVYIESMKKRCKAHLSQVGQDYK